MGFLDKLKNLFSGGGPDKQPPDFWGALDKRVTALEERIQVMQDMRALKGDAGSMQAECQEIRGILMKAAAGGPPEPHLVLLRRRVDLVRHAVAIIAGQEQQRETIWKEFLETFAACKDVLHYKTRAKYDRLRVDHDTRRHT